MSEGKNVPKIRFPGFEGEWEEYSFSDITKPAGSRNSQNLDLEPYAITSENGFIPQKDAHDDFGYMKNVDRKAYNIVPPASFGYNPARINVGSIGYYDGTENVIVSSLYEIFQTADYVYDRFLWHWFKSDAFLKWINKLQEGSVRLYFYYDKLCECKLHIPTLMEQKRIADSIDSIDTIIEGKQNELDKWKELKKGMLQKMFPKEGESVPEIRFPGFDKPWLQSTMGQHSEIKTGPFGTQLSSKEYLSEGIPVINVKNIGVGTILEAELDHVSQEKAMQLCDHIIQENDIVFGRKGAIGRHAIIENKHSGWMQGSDCIRVRFCSDLVPLYVNAFLQTSIVIDYLITRAYGSTMLTLTTEMLDSIPILIPNVEEQKKIANVFSIFDEYLALHQRELEKWKELKKGLLQQMFV